MALVTAGKAAPTFELAAIDGQNYSLAEALKQGPALVAFFKVECPTCQYTFPFLERLHRQFRAQGVRILGIAQDNARDSRDFAKEYGVTFPILIDDRPYKISNQYGISYVPSTFLINPEGQVEKVSEGFSKSDLLAIQQSLAKHYASRPAELFLASERVPEYKPG